MVVRMDKLRLVDAAILKRKAGGSTPPGRTTCPYSFLAAPRHTGETAAEDELRPLSERGDERAAGGVPGDTPRWP